MRLTAFSSSGQVFSEVVCYVGWGKERTPGLQGSLLHDGWFGGRSVGIRPVQCIKMIGIVGFYVADRWRWR